jgi:hypothetical protein
MLKRVDVILIIMPQECTDTEMTRQEASRLKHKLQALAAGKCVFILPLTGVTTIKVMLMMGRRARQLADTLHIPKPTLATTWDGTAEGGGLEVIVRHIEQVYNDHTERMRGIYPHKFDQGDIVAMANLLKATDSAAMQEAACMYLQHVEKCGNPGLWARLMEEEGAIRSLVAMLEATESYTVKTCMAYVMEQLAWGESKHIKANLMQAGAPKALVVMLDANHAGKTGLQGPAHIARDRLAMGALEGLAKGAREAKPHREGADEGTAPGSAFGLTVDLMDATTDSAMKAGLAAAIVQMAKTMEIGVLIGIEESGMVEEIGHLLGSENTLKVQETALGALRELIPQGREGHFAHWDMVLAQIVALLGNTTSMGIKEQVAGTLMCLADGNIEIKAKFIKAGADTHLLQMLAGNCDLSVKQAALDALVMLSVQNDAGAWEMAERGAIKSCVGIMQGTECPEVIRDGLARVVTLVMEGCKRVDSTLPDEERVMPEVEASLIQNSPWVFRITASNADTSGDIADLIKSYLGPDKTENEQMAAMGEIWKLITAGGKDREYIIEREDVIIKPLVALLENTESLRIKGLVAGMFRGMAEGNIGGQAKIIEAGAVTLLLQMLAGNCDDSYRVVACSALATLAMGNDAGAWAMAKTGVIKSLVDIMWGDTISDIMCPDTITHVVVATVTLMTKGCTQVDSTLPVEERVMPEVQASCQRWRGRGEDGMMRSMGILGPGLTTRALGGDRAESSNAGPSESRVIRITYRAATGQLPGS